MKFKVSKQELKFLVIVAAALMIWLSWVGVVYVSGDTSFDWSSQLNHQTRYFLPRLLDGRPVDPADTKLRPLGVMIENHLDARPPAGLDQASIVYEAIVESDITRFLALFDRKISIERIGPIRSVRPFFIELAEEYKAVLFHSGGSQDATYKLTYSPVVNVDDVSPDTIYFQRDPRRSAPHNLYLLPDGINRALEAKHVSPEADFRPWLFKKDQPSQSPTAPMVKIDFAANSDYNVTYQYNPQSNDYSRFIGGQSQKTEAGIILKAKNIVVLHTTARLLDSYGRLQVGIKGQGPVQIYQDGNVVYGRREKIDSRTIFYDQNDQEVKFNHGQIWVEIIYDNFPKL